MLEFNFSNNLIDYQGALEIADTVLGDKYIRSLDLSGNLMDEAACNLFMDLIQKCSNLVKLDLRNNPGYTN